jgi:hypothetical protein
MVHGSATVSSEILSTTHARDPLRDARLPLLRPTLLPTPSAPPSLDLPQDASAPAAPPSILSATNASLSSALPSSPRHLRRHHRIRPNNGCLHPIRAPFRPPHPAPNPSQIRGPSMEISIGTERGAFFNPIHRPLSTLHGAPNHPRQVRAKSALPSSASPFLTPRGERDPLPSRNPYPSSIHGAINPIYHTSVILLAFVSSGSERIRIGCIRRNNELRCDAIAGVPLLPATPLVWEFLRRPAFFCNVALFRLK